MADEPKVKVEMTVKGWVCPFCNTVYAPHVDRCVCSQRQFIPAPTPYTYPVYPVNPWPYGPGWPLPGDIICKTQ